MARPFRSMLQTAGITIAGRLLAAAIPARRLPSRLGRGCLTGTVTLATAAVRQLALLDSYYGFY